MTMTTHFLRRDPALIEPWTETCGQIRCLVEEKDGAAAEVHHVEIQDAKLHYHEHTDEFYYVIAGRGTMALDEETIELHRGVVVYVPRGVRHKAVGKLVVLTVCIPAGSTSGNTIVPPSASCATQAGERSETPAVTSTRSKEMLSAVPAHPSPAMTATR